MVGGASSREAPTVEAEGRARAERTANMDPMSVTLDVSKLSGWLKADASLNMEYMSVTLEVSQLEMSALKFCKPEKSELMSVMAETSQPAMGPYVAMASVGLASYARTAACRSALVVKMVAAVPRMFMASIAYWTCRYTTVTQACCTICCRIHHNSEGS